MLVALFLSACSKPQQKPAEEVYNKILASVAFQELSILSLEQIETVIGVEISQLSEAYAAVDASRYTPEAVFILTAKDQKSLSTIQELLQEYRQDLLDDYRDYRPDEAYKIEDAQVLTKGLQVVLMVAPDQSVAKTALENAWK